MGLAAAGDMAVRCQFGADLAIGKSLGVELFCQFDSLRLRLGNAAH